MGPWLRLRDGLALLIVLASTVAGIVAWVDGSVHIGLEVASADEIGDPFLAEFGETSVINSAMYVSTVVPDGNAVRNGVQPMMLVTDLRTTDGSEVERWSEPVQDDWGEPTYLPIEAVESNRLAGVKVGYLWEGETPSELFIQGTSQVERTWLEERLRLDIYLLVLGLGAGLAVWALLRRGVNGPVGRQEAVTAGAALATPYALATVVEVGNPIGIVLAYAAPIAVALLMGIGLAATHPEATYRRYGITAGVVAATVAGLLVWRHMTTPLLSPDERGPLFAVIGAVTLAPAAIASVTPERSVRDRLNLLLLSLVPLAALTLILPGTIVPPVPLLLVAGLLGWHLVPWAKVGHVLGGGFERLRSSDASADVSPLDTSAIRERRDLLTGSLLAVVALAHTVIQDGSAWALVLAAIAGGTVWLGTRQGVLGREWTDAAIPLAAGVAVPILLAPLSWAAYEARVPLVVPAALAALSVAHLVAERHTDPVLRGRLFLGAAGVALLAVLVSASGTALEVAVLAAIPLVPAVPVAFAERPGAQGISWRLETLAVALTPGVAATLLIPGGAGALLLGGWLAIITVWRYVAIVPLVGLANRSQLQRDLAVAAAETERARLAADLRDDALQQLTMLVRTLDESGQKAAADEAREIAAKLRSVVGDLRLPILDDLGAGAALEWLVERVEPLAGGPVKLERSDEARPPANVELAVFRVAQEALTNAIKHGKAPIAVRYDVRADGRVTLAIDDAGDGIGSEAAEEAPQQGHFGLANMQQRAEQIGALLDVRRWPAGGTRVALEWWPQ